MTERKKIDRLFQEKFRDFEVTPDEKVWSAIEAELTGKKKRRIIPFWWKISGAAAILLIGLLLFSRLFSSDPKAPSGNSDKVAVEQGVKGNNSVQPKGVNQAHDDKNDDLENQPDATILQNPHQVVSDGQQTATTDGRQVQKAGVPAGNVRSQQSVATNEKKPTGQHKSGRVNKPSVGLEKNNVLGNIDTENAVAVSQNKKSRKVKSGNPTANKNNGTIKENADKNSIPGTNDNNTSIANSNKEGNNIKNVQGFTVPDKNGNDQKQHDPNGIADTNTKKDTVKASPNALEELLNEKENKVTAKEQKINRWQITSNVAPIYFSSTSNGSPLDSRFEGNKKSYAPSMSYGVGAKYAINKKFSIKSGVNTVALEYNTTDVVFFQTENARKIENVTPNIQGSLIQVDNKPDGGAVTSFGRTITQFEGNVNQRIGYVEVPVEMSYQLVDRKFGMELIGGLSTMILNKNEVSIQSSGMQMNIGEASNLNDVHFSTNVGIGFKYNFLKSFQANFEPMLKYQINTFTSGAGNFKPYFFGLYTGVSYHF